LSRRHDRSRLIVTLFLTQRQPTVAGSDSRELSCEHERTTRRSHPSSTSSTSCRTSSSPDLPSPQHLKGVLREIVAHPTTVAGWSCCWPTYDCPAQRSGFTHKGVQPIDNTQSHNSAQASLIAWLCLTIDSYLPSQQLRQHPTDPYEENPNLSIQIPVAAAASTVGLRSSSAGGGAHLIVYGRCGVDGNCNDQGRETKKGQENSNNPAAAFSAFCK
jgi:hypothetical protein